MSLWVLAAGAMAIAWLILALSMTLYQFQDDAFIHLRISQHLGEKGMFSFNGEAQHFSTSSPLYTTVLAAFWSITKNPMLPKFVNIFIFISILSLLLSGILYIFSKNRLAQAFIVVSFVLLVSPFGLRWLTDGMETGLVAFVAILLAVATNILKTQSSTRAPILFAIAILSFVAVALRIEFAFVLALGGAALFAHTTLSGQKLGLNLRYASWKLISLGFGGIAALISIYLIFGHLFPDTGLAKQGAGMVDLIGTLRG